MGARGPLSKDPEDRVRRNKTGEDGIGDDIIQMDGEVRPPRVEFETRVVQDMWVAIQQSVNTQYYEPSDWQYAVLTLNMWDNVLADGKMPGAMLLSALDSMLSKMLITEGDRRRMKIFARRKREEVKSTVKAEYFYKEAFDEQQKARLSLVVDLNEEMG